MQKSIKPIESVEQRSSWKILGRVICLVGKFEIRMANGKWLRNRFSMLATAHKQFQRQTNRVLQYLMMLVTFFRDIIFSWHILQIQEIRFFVFKNYISNPQCLKK